MRPLTDLEHRVIVDKATERPFTGEYVDCWREGVYVCRQCGAELYRSEDKFRSGCGWPSFDDEIEGAVLRQTDRDGERTEILCAHCGGHLGHVFCGEGFTPKNVRHCVNSVSMEFRAKVDSELEIAYYAGGCFWGMEYMMQRQAGVVDVTSGFMGGAVENPTYEEVYRDDTGHAETVRVRFDPKQVSYEELTKLFFEIHDPTQVDGQGPDLGTRYRSEIFYLTRAQRQTAEEVMDILMRKGYRLATALTPASTFYPAEDYHQDYYERKGTTPYCHAYTKRF